MGKVNTVYSLDGERWDSLCQRVLNQSSPDIVNIARRMNPKLARRCAFTLPAGEKVLLPDITASFEVEKKEVRLAPWQR